jgi:hypothetical protein
MTIRIIPPEGIFMGWRIKRKYWGIALYFHNLQCDRRWLFGVRIGRRVFGYLTHGDATPDMMSYREAGWFLFKKQYISGQKI